VLIERELIVSATVQNEHAVPFVQFLETFWTYDESPYVAEKIAHNQRISRRHCYERLNNVKNHYPDHFGDKLLQEITRSDLRTSSIAIVIIPLSSAGRVP
jgi:hypothetical protein